MLDICFQLVYLTALSWTSMWRKILLVKALDARCVNNKDKFSRTKGATTLSITLKANTSPIHLSIIVTPVTKLCPRPKLNQGTKRNVAKLSCHWFEIVILFYFYASQVKIKFLLSRMYFNWRQTKVFRTTHSKSCGWNIPQEAVHVHNLW